MSPVKFIMKTRQGFRLCCPTCGITSTFVSPGDRNPHRSTHANCKRCQTPIANRSTIETAIQHLCAGDEGAAKSMKADVFNHIEVID